MFNGTNLNWVELDPEYWWQQADEMFDDMKKMYAVNGSRKAVCNFCHGTIERDLKAILAEQGRLNDKDAHHKVVALAKKSGVFNDLQPHAKAFLIQINTLHSSATYPAYDTQQEIWNDSANYKSIIINTGRMHKLLSGWKGTGETK